MKIVGRALLIFMGVTALGACSRQEPPASPTPPAAAQPVPAAQPAPVEEAAPVPVPLTPEQVAHLVRPQSPVLGAAKAPVTVVEVLDPACGACRAYAPVVQQLLFLYPEEVRVVVRFANFHPGSEEAIRLLEAARRQGKFEPLLDALFERQEEWASHSGPNTDVIWQIAAKLGVKESRARADAASASTDDMLRREAADLRALKVESTPTFFVDGKLLPAYSPGQFFDFMKNEVLNAKAAAPAKP